MKYRGYTITAEVTAYEMWTLKADGTIDKVEEELEHSITGYMFREDVTEDAEFIAMSEARIADLHGIVDEMIDRQSMTEFINFVGGAK